MTEESPTQPNPPAPQPKFDASKPHQQRPRLRPVRGFPAQMGDKTVLGLADARQISDKVVFTMPAAQMVLPMMDGQKSVDEIVAAVGRGLTRGVLEPLIAQLDDAGLLVGPTFDAIVTKMRAEFDSAENLPPASTAQFADMLADAAVGNGKPATDEQRAEVGPKRLREVFDMWIDQALKEAKNPSLDTLPAAIVTPHLDYSRGWINYANVYGRLRVVDRPDRIVILGTNHFGESSGVCGCDKGYTTPFGTCPVDKAFVEALAKNLGQENTKKLFANRYDHEREHSVELQIPWIQHTFGPDAQGNYPPVFGALIHDPSVNSGESYDGKGLAFEPFVEALKKTIREMPGKTLVVSSADLSHVGPAFGDQQAMAGATPEAEAARNRVFQHDKEMLELYANRKPDELLSSMAWQQNPTRWCSLGNMIAAMKVTEPASAELYNYVATMDEQGTTLVSCVGMALK